MLAALQSGAARLRRAGQGAVAAMAVNSVGEFVENCLGVARCEQCGVETDTDGQLVAIGVKEDTGTGEGTQRRDRGKTE